MSKKTIFLLRHLCLAVCFVAGFFCFHLGRELWCDLQSFAKLNTKVVAQVEKSLVAKKDGKIQLRVAYNYEANGRNYHGASTFKKLFFKNEKEALNLAEKLEKELIDLWICKERPLITALERDYPLAKIIELFFVLSLAIYAFIIRNQLLFFAAPLQKGAPVFVANNKRPSF